MRTIGVCFGQEARSQLLTLPSFVKYVTEALPVVMQGEIDKLNARLTEHVFLLPGIQLA